MSDKERGLYEKYHVERWDEKEVGECIVLELDDPNSWPALRMWADTVEVAGFGPLANDVRRRVAAFEAATA